MRNYIQDGDILTVTLTKDVNSGDLVLLGSSKTPAVAYGSYAANVPGEYALDGVFELPAVAADAAVVGDAAFFDAAAGTVTAKADGNVPVGIYAAPKAANVSIARVRLLRTQ
ncbi:capsid cement protein [Burkholderia sp. Bmkn7]|uniref:capsid cement protein n=1 Tax=Burkholderia sp. Bmkn7 TaxID=3236841 RepID=UPI0034E3D161